MNLNWVEDEDYIAGLDNRQAAMERLAEIKKIQAQNEQKAMYVEEERGGFKVLVRVVRGHKWAEIMAKLLDIQFETGCKWHLNSECCLFVAECSENGIEKFTGIRFAGATVRDHALKAIEMYESLQNKK